MNLRNNIAAAVIAAAGDERQNHDERKDRCKELFHKDTSRFDFPPEAQKRYVPCSTYRSDFKQMLTAPPASPGETGAVDPYWDPLNPEHGFPRNLVSSSI